MIEFNFSPFPTLETERLLLREIKDEDIDTFFFMRRDERVMRYVDRPRPEKIEDLHPFMYQIKTGQKENTNICWIIELKEAPGVMIGQIGYWRSDMENHRGEVGYMLQYGYFGKGYASEAIKPVLEYGFDKMGFHSIKGCIAPENAASAHVLEKAGFKKEAHFREDYIFNGQFFDTVVYCALKSDLQAK